MRSLLLPLALAMPGAALPPRVAAQESVVAPFEGIVSYTARDASGSHTVSYAISKGLVRVDVRAAHDTSAMIFDPGSQILWVVLPERQMYMQLNVPPVDASAYLEQTGPRPLRVGEMRRIAGHPCATWLVREEDREIEVCVADDLGAPSGIDNAVDQSIGRAAWYRRMTAQGLFPLRISTRNSSGREVSRLEATRVERKALDRAYFRPPPDYRKVLIPTMRPPDRW